MTTTIITARERAQAPIGLPYIAPLMAHAWFRCDITAGSGIYKLGRDVAGLKSVPSRFLPTVSGTPSWAGTPISATPRGSEG